ncbi:Rpn family recombination-promoting nuclease/putative transposase [Clostridiales bacterium COT073_COT-073]|nr:Rpn family recombination-promoting nuclease/putative transposase [Clostridiales bacterium COT073_COT-073]
MDRSSKKENSKFKKKEELNQPHDLFFKANMGQKEILTDFLQNYLPNELREIIQYSSFVQVEPKNISSNLKPGEADLLFRFQLPNINGYLLLLMEHKSYEDKYTPIQIMRYITEIWQHDLAQKQSLSPILPLVFHQGKKCWQYPQLKDYLPLDMPIALLPYMPLYQALYYDFSWENAEILKGGNLSFELYIYLKTIISIYEPKLSEFQEQTLELFRVISQFEVDTLVEIATKTITYLGTARKDFSEEKIIELVKQSGGEKTMETIFDRIEQQGIVIGEKRGEIRGISIGEQRGKQQEKLAFAVKLKRDLFPIEKIMEYTGLSREEILDL